MLKIPDRGQNCLTCRTAISAHIPRGMQNPRVNPKINTFEMTVIKITMSN